MYTFIFVVFFLSLVNTFNMANDTLEITIKTDYFPRFQKPVIVGFFSVDVDRKLDPGATNLKYLHQGENKIRHDLNEGFDEYIGKRRTTDNEEKIDMLLNWMVDNNYLKNVVKDNDLQKKKYTFVCNRGLLSLVMRTPFEYQEGWRIVATKVKNIIFLVSFYTDERKMKMQTPLTQQEQRFEYWGFKFEQCLLSDSPQEKPNTSKAINSNEEFNLVFRSKLNENYLIYGAEVDGVDTVEHIKEVNCSVLNELKFLELKTNRIITFEKQDLNFKRHKLMRWWCQSFLVGIDNVTCGFRNDTGFVEEIRRYSVRELPKIAEGLWNATACMRFLDDFLTYVKQTLAGEPDYTTYRFDWKHRMSHVTRQKVTNKSEYVILPEGFTL